MKPKALITGLMGEDGAYLPELLRSKSFEVLGIKRRATLSNTDWIDHVCQDSHVSDRNLALHYAGLTDSTNLIRTIEQIQPDEIHNLASMSHVAVSFDTPEYTANANGIGTLRILEAIRILGLEKKTRFHQASTSGIYGLVQEVPQEETTPFYPRSPYSVAKLYAYWITVNYREAYRICGCSNGILFNHESPLRGETFVTRALARINLGLQDCLYLGNLGALRDWGHTTNHAETQWLMLQQKHPKVFLIATEVQYSVHGCVTADAKELGFKITWDGSGIEEKGSIHSPDGAEKDHCSGSPPLLQSHRDQNPTRRSRLSRAKARLNGPNYLRETGPRNGSRRSQERRARRTDITAWSSRLRLSRVSHEA